LDSSTITGRGSTSMAMATAAARKTALTTWEGIWYVLQCVAFGAGYFGKVPAKKAMQDFGLTEMTGAEHFWYIVQCICFGAGYFAKIPTAKALSELPQYRSQRQAGFGTLSQAPPPLGMPPAESVVSTNASDAVEATEATPDSQPNFEQEPPTD
jgi:hypothetical protein